VTKHKKKKWARPMLTVLVRNKDVQESILQTCKHVTECFTPTGPNSDHFACRSGQCQGEGGVYVPACENQWLCSGCDPCFIELYS
jgi:hypothetical protein